MFLGILTLITALTISAVAIYYSVAGLMTIFAAAAIPIMIMGGALEVGKLVTAVWLHRYWNQATWWLKTYLTVAVLVLMFITSMGIFGFLSRAHIEQTANANESLARIERIDTDIARQQAAIQRAQERIQSVRTQDLARDNEIQAQIDIEQQRIDSAYQRIEPAIQEQQVIIQTEQAKTQDRIQFIQTDIDAIDTELSSLRNALSTNDIRLAQGIVGVQQDGALGPNTERAIDEFRAARQQARQTLVDQISIIQGEQSPILNAAREEISRLRNLTEQQIADSNQLINRLREQLGQSNLEEIEQVVAQQQLRIAEANSAIDELTEQKFVLETEYRKLEAEVGPLKYIAEFVYGESANKDLLEEAVRWVILIIIFVFDPLAVLLLIASQHTFMLHRKEKQQVDTTIEEKSIEETPIEETTIDDSVIMTDDILTPDANNLQQEEVSSPVVEELEDQKKSIELSEELKQARYNELEAQESDEDWTAAKRSWKEDHPDLTIKKIKELYVAGKIDILPWEDYLDSKKNYIVKQGQTQITREIKS
jgi:hypothetical protein